MHRSARQWGETSAAQLAKTMGPQANALRKEFLDDYREAFRAPPCIHCPNQLGEALQKLIRKLQLMEHSKGKNSGWKLHPRYEGLPLIAAETRYNFITTDMLTDEIAALIVAHSALHEQAFEQVPEGVSFDARHRIIWRGKTDIQQPIQPKNTQKAKAGKLATQ